MAFVYEGQTVTKRIEFSGTVTGTPTAQLYVDGVSSGSPVNGTGSGAVWVFSLTIPDTVAIGNYVTGVASATVSAIAQTIEMLAGPVVEVFTLSAVASFVGGSLIDEEGELSRSIIVGDDYTADIERELKWRVAKPDLVLANTVAKFGAKLRGEQAFLITGTIAAITVSGTDYWDLSFDLPASETTDLSEATYDYSVELQQSTPDKYVTVQIGTFHVKRDAVPSP